MTDPNDDEQQREYERDSLADAADERREREDEQLYRHDMRIDRECD